MQILGPRNQIITIVGAQTVEGIPPLLCCVSEDSTISAAATEDLRLQRPKKLDCILVCNASGFGVSATPS